MGCSFESLVLLFFYSLLFLDSREGRASVCSVGWFFVLGCVGMLLGCVTDLKKMLFHVKNFVKLCCFFVVSHKWVVG